MNSKKLKILAIALIMILQTVLPTLSYAVGETMNLNIQDTRPLSEDNNNTDSNDEVYTFEKESGVNESIFKIYDTADKDENDTLLYTKALYCLRGGLGFGDVEYIEDLNNNSVQYTNIGDMKADATNIINTYNVNTNANIDESYTDGDNTFTPYNAILWIADNMYVYDANSENNGIQKQFLIDNVKDYCNKVYEEVGNANYIDVDISDLTEDDIEVVQQFAIWYFSNYGETGDFGLYSLASTVYLGNIIKINGVNLEDISEARYRQATYLYEYLINSAKANANKYGTEATRKVETVLPTVEFDKTVKPTITTVTKSLYDYYLIGPFKIDGNTSDIKYDFSSTLKYTNTEGENLVADNEGEQYISDASGNQIDRATTIEEMIGQGEFYIAALKETTDRVGLIMGYDIAEFELEISYAYKYNQTEATMWIAEQKDQPVLLVEKEIKNGGATLTASSKIITGNFDINIEKYDEADSLLTGADFTIETPDREGVTLTNNNNGKFNTGNIEITEEGQSYIYDITETVVPEGYIGLTEALRMKIETGLNAEGTAYVVKDAYFIDNAGEKIQSDIAGIVVNAEGTSITISIENKSIKSFDLSLRKYITKVNETEITNRVPNVDLTDLNVATTTASYKHRKDPVEVNTGDSVIYNITIYNEGENAGRATKIVDQLPSGLKFVEVVSGNYELDTYFFGDDTNTLTLRETANNTDLAAYQEGNRELASTTIQIKCEVTETVSSTNKVLTNVAWISEAYNADTAETITTQVGSDRDSEPRTAPDETAQELRTTDIGYTGKDSHEESALANAETYFQGEQDDDDFEKLVIKGRSFDLSLRKYITKVEDEEITNRIPNVNIEGLKGVDTTAEYKHRKDPVAVDTGDKVIYTITIYNEGSISGRATKVIDQLPAGLKFLRVVSGNYEVESYDETTDNKLTLKETENNINLNAFDAENGKLDTATIQIECEVTETIGAQNKVLTNIAWITEAYNAETGETITVRVGHDRDSEPATAPAETAQDLRTTDIGYTGKDNYTESSLANSETYFEGKQDDDDFEKLIIKTKEFDLALRKYIKAINGEILSGDDSRVPTINTESLETSKTAVYTHSKAPLTVKHGDIVTYTIRVYNEGELDGFATKIADYIPEGLGYILNYKQNTDNSWIVEGTENEVIALVGEDGLYAEEADVKNLTVEDFYETTSLSEVNIVKGKVTLHSSKLDDEVIKGYGKTAEEGDSWQASSHDSSDGLFYKEIDVACVVLAENNYMDILRNIAEIDEDKAIDENGNEIEIDDRDSTPENADLDNYEFREENSTYQEDDDDYEPIQLKYFDLSLRKFITAVEGEEVTTRVPEFYIDEEGNYKYNHSKEPVEVANGDEVTYTIRIFNEGTIAGYAEEIEDDIPAGLVFLPENETNKEYGWVMYREVSEDEDITGKVTLERNGKLYVETDNAEEATIIRTQYLSEANGAINEEGVNENLISAFNSVTMTDGPDYRDVKVVFQVDESKIAEDNSDRIITNRAHITDDSDDDDDSIPDEWNDGEDDQDEEHVYVKTFDLALFKWVTKTIVTVDGKTKTTETGFRPNTGKTEQEGEDYRDNEDPEPIASVTIDKKKINSTEVKFAYTIKVVNEGEIAGYATEIRDYVPAGLKFVAEDNPLWTDEGNNVISTRALETKLLNPGESAEIEVIFTWINGEDNLGVKTNIAAIVEDYNEKGAKDEDSDPGNENIPEYNEEQEDDDDYAQVILVLKTGSEPVYIELSLAVLSIISTGIILIKKYVL